MSWVTGGSASTPTFPQGMTTLAKYYPAPGVAQFSLGVQHEVIPSLIWVNQYVGNIGWPSERQHSNQRLQLVHIDG